MKNIRYGLLTVLLISSIQATQLGIMIFDYEDAIENRPSPRMDLSTGTLVQPTEEETAPADVHIRVKLEKIKQELALRNIDPNQPLADGTLPLGHAASISLPNLVKVLVENGANVFAKDAKKRTPISYSFSNDLRRKTYSESTIYLAKIMGIEKLPEHPGALLGKIKIERYVSGFDKAIGAYILTLQKAKRSVTQKRRTLRASKKMLGIRYDTRRRHIAIRESLDRAKKRTTELLSREAEEAHLAAAAENENFIPIGMLPW